MIKRSVHGYFWFGTCVRYLQDVSAGSFLGEEEDWAVIGNLARFFTYLDNLNLQVTKIVSADLKALHRELAQLDPELGLSEDQAQSLASEVRSVRNTLEAELRGLEAYVVTPKRMDVDRLLENISSLLSPHVFNKLPSIAQFDLSESGKCIAFERPTASAFHLLRATEAVLREFYCAIVLRGRVGLMWGAMVQDLRKRRKARPYEVLINNLDNIRNSFRNPTQHPEKIYDIHEVQDLWGICIDAINRMAVALP